MKRNNTRRFVPVAAAWAALALTGCAVGPNYRTPEVSTPDRFHAAPTSQPATRPAQLEQWWTLLHDPMLDSLVERAGRTSLDLQLASSRLREARAQRGVVAADWFPSVGTGADYRYKGVSRTALPEPKTSGSSGGSKLPSVTIQPGQPDGAGGLTPPTITVNPPGSGQSQSGGAASLSALTPRQQNLFQAGFDATWELDVFGGVSRAVEAAESDIQAAWENVNDVRITLIAEVARNYVDAREFQRRIVIAEESIASQQDTAKLARSLFDAGLTSELDAAQAEAQLATTRSQIPGLQTQFLRSVHRLGVLLGEEPGVLLADMETQKPIPAVPPDVPSGLPSDLLLRRPDIRRADREAAAATARIGVATADLFPRFSLTGSFGTQTHDMKHFLDAKSLFWSVGPGVSWPIFEGGRIVANIEVQNARQEQAMLRYRQVILSALEDVENAMVSYGHEQVRHRHLADAVVANRRALELANERYTKGVAAFLNVLEAQRSLYFSQDQMIQSESAAVASLIALYKALGGGWGPSAG